MIYKNKLLVGALEKCCLPDLQIEGLDARIDTGAQTSSLHVDNIVEYRKEGRKWIEFYIHPDIHNVEKIVKCHAKVKAKRRIKSSSGCTQTRYVIETRIVIGSMQWKIEISLSDRSSMTYLMLLGREAMKDKVIVSPGENFIQSKC
ncbi:ATP-dependent zinc protease [Psychromonas antarctica]|uniref:ATP-dependent zinc protease family protein n=1 Tax=Psychromonas antarctica TaxID=67573 RepID=UPI001EE9829A|nr:ATP-dependent zinc protease [Psychromonas antarctica]MCG6202455.1 ATP-dependent zinc protease [Psychromonas antarctica]